MPFFLLHRACEHACNSHTACVGVIFFWGLCEPVVVLECTCSTMCAQHAEHVVHTCIYL